MREFNNDNEESREIWSKNHDVITFDILQKFWSQLSLQQKRMLLRIDKQSFIEQARKNLYCSRCNGLLLEGFSQIVRYARAMQQYGDGPHLTNSSYSELYDAHDPTPEDDILNPSVYPWGGLAATKDGWLTILNIFVNSRSMEPLQNVFNCARAREHEREFQFPDACGGRGRGWISQGMGNNGRGGHTIRETCALHTARLPCDMLVDYWSDLGEEMKISFLQMKEEDFIERLMHRFDSKRFCKDCRRNVIREFKELKELKRTRREPRCTSWFCAADTAFQYEMSHDTVQADWHEFFTDTITTYHHFEWAVGTGEGKSDILQFENVGMNRSVKVSGLNLGDLNSCFITLRAWKSKDRYSEFCVKAHALKGQPCVHRRLVIGDGFVAITKGESIRSFFEIAEEIEEEEDDYALDKEGNDMDDDGPWPQKHAKSPELAREFLLDAATVIFKEQIEKAYREHTAQQNAHSVFVSLALNLLEERIHVACKEIITLEKQMKLLEEEEREKCEEEERRERKRLKEREKKNRRKEKRKGKEKETENKQVESNSIPVISPITIDDTSPSTVENVNSASDHCEIITPYINGDLPKSIDEEENLNNENLDVSDSSGNFILEQSKSTRKKLRSKMDSRSSDYNEFPEKSFKTHTRDRYKYSSSSRHDKFDYQSCACNNNLQNCGSKSKDVYHMPSNRTMAYRITSPVPPKGKGQVKQVWEPVSSRNPTATNQPEESLSKCDEADKSLSNCDDCDGMKDAMKSSSSSDNCSSCLSSSSSQNTESSSTSDSEDAVSPHSQESEDFSHKPKTNEEESKAVDLPNENLSDKDPELLNGSNLQPPVIHTPSIITPVYSYHDHGLDLWQGAVYSRYVPYQYSTQFVFPSSPALAYSFKPMPFVQYNPLRALTAPLCDVVKPIPNAVKPIPNAEAVISSKICCDDDPAFSLFHFGGPVAGRTGFNLSCVSMDEKIACSVEDMLIKEYSLFP